MAIELVTDHREVSKMNIDRFFTFFKRSLATMLVIQVVLAGYAHYVYLVHGAHVVTNWDVRLAQAGAIMLPGIWVVGCIIRFATLPVTRFIHVKTQSTLAYAMKEPLIRLPTTGPYPSPDFDHVRRQFGPLTSQEVNDLAEHAYAQFGLSRGR